jgi:hypothetical protein
MGSVPRHALGMTNKPVSWIVDYAEVTRAHSIRVPVKSSNTAPLQRQIVPRDVDHDAAPYGTRSVIDRHRRDGEACGHVGDRLSQRRQAPQDACRSIGPQYDGIIFDASE